MAGKAGGINYIPGTYAKRRPGSEELAGHYVRAWESRRMAMEAEQRAAEQALELPPCIAFSRKIGVGALEIADIVAEKLKCRVADRELIEQIAGQANISTQAIAYFDERFPGYINRTMKYLFGEKSFIDSDYTRHLFSAVIAIAGLEPTIFVGRGVHLVLPREKVLAVRCIGSDDYRIQRVADIMHIHRDDARKRLHDIDREQAAFFKKVFGKKNASAYEFDLILNMDHLADPADVAQIVVLAFNKKFGRTG